MPSRPALALSLLFLVSCRGDAELRSSAQPLIADQAHGTGVHGLWFLPPMVPQPRLEGRFLGGLDPVVRIDELDGGLLPLGTLATYTRSSGVGGETVRETSDPLYLVNWKTRAFALDPRHLFRVNVLLQGRVVGFADVQIFADKNQAKRADGNEVVALTSEGTLPIKFWINSCGPVVCAALDQCHGAGVCEAATGICSNPAAPDGNSCDDGDVCTASDTCRAGTCVGEGLSPVCAPPPDTCFAHVGQGPADPGGNPGLLAVREGARLYEVAYNGGLRVYDVALPATPVLMATMALPGVHGIAVKGTIVYLSYVEGPAAYDFTDPTHPVQLWLAPPREGDDHSIALEINGNTLIESSGMRLRTYDISDPRAPVEIGSVGFLAGVDISVGGSKAYLAGAYQGVHMVDLSDRAAPQIAGSFHPPGIGYVQAVAATDEAVLALDDSTGLYFLERDTLAPLAFVPLGGGGSGITVRGHLAFVSTASAVAIFDVATPTAPALVRRVEIDPRLTTRSTALGEDRAWVSGFVQPADAATVPTLHVIDIGCL